MDHERKNVWKALVETAQGLRKTDGRDTVSDSHIELGGMYGRALEVRLRQHRAGAWEQSYRLCTSRGEITVTMARQGVFIFEHGDLMITARSRGAGAGFIDELALALASPLDAALAAPAPADAAPAVAVPADSVPAVAVLRPPNPVAGRYARLGARNDADGVCWEMFKLFIGHDPEVGEIFFRVSTATSRVVFVEKWAGYRAPVLTHLDRCLGAGRTLEARQLVEVTGGVRFTVRPDWIVRPHAGHVRITDADDEAVLEVSHQPYPLHPRLPGVVARVAVALEIDGRSDAAAPIAHCDRGDLEHAWAEFEYETEDTKTGLRRTARGRVSVMANEALHSLATYAYWPEDEAWAVPEWHRIMATMELAIRAD